MIHPREREMLKMWALIGMVLFRAIKGDAPCMWVCECVGVGVGECPDKRSFSDLSHILTYSHTHIPNGTAKRGGSSMREGMSAMASADQSGEIIAAP